MAPNSQLVLLDDATPKRKGNYSRATARFQFLLTDELDHIITTGTPKPTNFKEAFTLFSTLFPF